MQNQATLEKIIQKTKSKSDRPKTKLEILISKAQQYTNYLITRHLKAESAKRSDDGKKSKRRRNKRGGSSEEIGET